MGCLTRIAASLVLWMEEYVVRLNRAVQRRAVPTPYCFPIMPAPIVRCNDGMDSSLDLIGIEVPSRIRFH